MTELYHSVRPRVSKSAQTDGMDSLSCIARSSSAEIFGVPLGLQDYLLIAFVSVVGSAATAGLTGAVVMLTLTLSTLGLPVEGVALLLAVDPILDMMRTATNVAGQALVPTIVAKREGILDLAANETVVSCNGNGQCFDTNNDTLAADRPLGVPRNSLITDPFKNVDLRVSRTIPIRGDTVNEMDEGFAVQLENITGAGAGERTKGLALIIDDE